MRKTYIDNIRWITIVLVVIYHVIYMFNGVETAGVLGTPGKVQLQDTYLYIVYPWFMLLLFVISGMSARFYLDKHTHKEFVRSKTRKLLVPCTIGLPVFWWILGYLNLQLSGAYVNMAGAVPGPILFLIMASSGIGPMWYIQTLWLLCLLLVLIRKIEKDRFYGFCSKANMFILLALVLIIWGGAQLFNTPVIIVYRFGIYGAGFFIGYFVLSHEEVMDRLSKYWLPLLVATLVLCVAEVVCFWQKPYASHEVLDTLLCNVYAWIATLGILATMKKWGNFENAFTKWMTKKSWGIYLFHYLTLAAGAWLISQYLPNMPVAGSYIVTGICAFGGALVLYEVISHIPVFRWCICGIGGKKK